MALTAATLVQRTRRFVGDWPDVDVTTASIASNGTTLTVADSSIYSVRMGIQVDQEALQVTALPSGTTLTVRRGLYGSTAASHASAASVLVRPAFFDLEYLDGLNAGILASFPSLYRPVIDESITLLSNVYEYTVPNMPGTYEPTASVPIPRLSRVSVLESGDLTYRNLIGWRVLRGTTPKIKLRRANKVGTLRVEGYGPLPSLASLSDSVDALFPPEAVDVLPEYAAAHLLASGEARRVRLDVGAVDQREQANRAGSSLQASNALLSRFYKRLSDSAMSPMGPHIISVF